MRLAGLIRGEFVKRAVASMALGALVTVVGLSLLTLPQAALAAPTTSAVRAEIDVLLDRLDASGCRFQRNGTWHNAAEARKHLLHKLDAIERRGTMSSTEQFIDLAATRSSVTSREYTVACGSDASQPSRSWMLRELSRVRGRGD